MITVNIEQLLKKPVRKIFKKHLKRFIDSENDEDFSPGKIKIEIDLGCDEQNEN